MIVRRIIKARPAVKVRLSFKSGLAVGKGWKNKIKMNTPRQILK